MSSVKNALLKEWNRLGKKYDRSNNTFKQLVIDYYFESGSTKELMKTLCLSRNVFNEIFYIDSFGSKYYAKKESEKKSISSVLLAKTKDEQKKKEETKRPRYSDEVKNKAIAMFNKNGNAAAVAKALNVPYNTVRSWINNPKTMENSSTRTKFDWNDTAFIAEIIDYLIESKAPMSKVCTDLGINRGILEKILYVDNFGKKYYADKKKDLQAKEETNRALTKEYSPNIIIKALEAIDNGASIDETAVKYGAISEVVESWVKTYKPFIDCYTKELKKFYGVDMADNINRSLTEVCTGKGLGNIDRYIDEYKAGLSISSISKKYKLDPAYLTTLVTARLAFGLGRSVGVSNTLDDYEKITRLLDELNTETEKIAKKYADTLSAKEFLSKH